MQTILILSQFAVLCLLPRTGAQEPCVAREPELKKLCYEDRDLMLTVMPGNLEVLMPAYGSYETFFTLMDPHTHCQDPAGYREAAVCSLNVSRQCFDPDGTLGSIPSNEPVVAGMQRLCDLRDQVDVACFKMFFNAAADCAHYNMPLSGMDLIRASQKDITCTMTELTYDCFEVLMKPLCGENTTNIYLEQLSNYQLPDFCKNDWEPTRPRQRLFHELNHNDDDNRPSAAAPISTPVTTIVSTTAIISLVSLFLVTMSSACVYI